MKKIIAIFFIICPLIITTVVFLSPDREISSLEKRSLKTRASISSSLKSNEFQSALESYLSDQFPMRDTLVSLQIYTKIALGKRDINGAYIGKNNRLFEKITDSDIKEKTVDKLIRYINMVDRDAYVMLVPSAGIMLKNELPENALMYDYDRIYNKIAKNTNAKMLDLRQVLTESDDYYLTDHHWTFKGASKAYMLLSCKNCNYNFKTVATDFKGALFSKIPISNMPQDTIEIRADIPNLKVEADGKNIDFYDMAALNTDDKYNIFQGGNHGWVTITNPENAGKKSILLIKDSFANSFVQFMVDDYYQIIMLDTRYSLITIPQAVELANADEVLFLSEVK